MLSLSTKALLRKYNITPLKAFGQNFLLDDNIARKIVGLIPSTASHVIEIGPGAAALSRYIKAPLTLIEKDRRLEELLKESLPNATLYIQDLLTTDLDSVVTPETIILSNLPYNITTPILERLEKFIPLVPYMVFMVQKEVAERLCAKPCTKSYGKLSVVMQHLYAIRKHFDVPPSAFFPKPSVTSSIISMTPLTRSLNTQKLKKVKQLTSLLFQKRRKMLRTILPFTESFYKELGLTGQERPDAIDVETIVSLSNSYPS